MKTIVTFEVMRPPTLPSRNDYNSLGLFLSFDEQKRLVAIAVTVEHAETTDREDVIAEAHARIQTFLDLVQFRLGREVRLGQIGTQPIGPGPATATVRMSTTIPVGAALAAPLPLPPPEVLSNVSSELAMQLGWYNGAQSSPWVLTRIACYFQVLEMSRLTSAGIYKPPEEMKWLRDAVSHPLPDNRRIKEYLSKNIQAEWIDPRNERHIRFLETKVRVLQDEARRVIEEKLPNW